MIFAFLFGLSMDYEVFMLARMREAYDETGSTDKAIELGLARTGKLVTSGALILMFAFLVLSTSPGYEIKPLAIGLAAGIILDATVIRALLVPATDAAARQRELVPAALARMADGRPRGAATARRSARGAPRIRSLTPFSAVGRRALRLPTAASRAAFTGGPPPTERKAPQCLRPPPRIPFDSKATSSPS